MSPRTVFHVSEEDAIERFEPRPTTGQDEPEVIDNPIVELAKRDVELRLLPSLWPLRDAVIASSLAFSIIRMRNAQPRRS